MEIEDYVRFFVALMFVLGLMGAAALIGRKFGYGTAITKNSKRISIIETKIVDQRNRMVLARCDDKEYLFLVGPDGQTVLDTNPAKQSETPA